MKKFISAMLCVMLVCSLVCIAPVYAEAAPIQVIANESWTNATYDAETGYLTNVVIDNTDPANPVDRSYTFNWSPSNPSVIQPCYGLYTLDKNTNTFPATATEVVIPSQIVYEGETYNITTIDNKVFGHFNKKATTIKRLVFSEGITAIPAQLCYKSTSLKEVKIYGNTITSIGQDAFNSASAISTFELPESLETMGAAFGSGNLPSTFVIPWRVTTIPDNCFKGKVSCDHLYFKGNMQHVGNAFQQGWTSGVRNIYFEGASAPTLGTSMLHNNFKTNLTVHYPANRAAYANFENAFNVASGIYVVNDGVADTTQKTDSTDTATLSYAKIQTSSSVINDVVYDEETGEYTVHYNVVIGESDWNTYKDTAVAYIALYDGEDLVKVKKISLTDALSSTVFANFETAPTRAKLLVWTDNSSLVKPLITAAEFEIE